MEPDIPAERFVRHLTRPRHSSPADIVRWSGATQAEDYEPGLWAIGLRCGVDRAAVEGAVSARRIVRTWPMRGTLHCVPACCVGVEVTRRRRPGRASLVQRFGIVSCVALLIACAGSADSYEPPILTTPPDDAIVFQIGEMTDSIGDREFARIKTSVLSESGRFLAVADGKSEPYLRVVDLAMNTVVSFGNRGGGPGELRGADELTFLGDTLLLTLAARGRLELFSPTGVWLRGFRVHDSGVTLSSITTGCGGRLFGYGVPTGLVLVRPDSMPWVHELTVDESLGATPLVDFVRHGTMAWGALFGFSGSAAGLLVWKKEDNSGYWASCESFLPELWSPPLSPVVQSASASGGMVLVLPDTLFAGAAALDNRKIWGRTPRDGEPYTAIRVVSDGVCKEVRLRGRWLIHDAHAVGLVVSVNDPVPAVKILAWEWLDSQLRPVRCPG